MIPNRRLVLPYAAPFMAYVLIASLFGDLLSKELNYSLRIVLTSSLLVWAWKWYFPLGGPKSPLISALWGGLVGIVGIIIWIVTLIPFADPEAAKSWSMSAFALRLLAAGLLVPLAEEILMRGFVFRLALQWWEGKAHKEDEPLAIALDEKSVNDVQPGAWSWMAVIISTIAFASGHHMYEWPAAICFGLLMSMLWIVRKDLISCIVAHGVANIVLAIYVLQTDSWYLW